MSCDPAIAEAIGAISLDVESECRGVEHNVIDGGFRPAKQSSRGRGSRALDRHNPVDSEDTSCNIRVVSSITEFETWVTSTRGKNQHQPRLGSRSDGYYRADRVDHVLRRYVHPRGAVCIGWRYARKRDVHAKRDVCPGLSPSLQRPRRDDYAAEHR